MPEVLTKADIAQFIRENLTISVSDKDYYDYGSKSTVFTIKLLLTDPISKEEEVIGQGEVSIDMR